jgi:hypothetical protein
VLRKLDLGDYRWMSYDDANALSEEVGREEDATKMTLFLSSLFSIFQ